MLHQFKVDSMSVEVYRNRQEMGRAAASKVASSIKKALSEKGEVRMIFASAPSQNEFLQHLKLECDIDWSKITAFHMDEYIGLDANAPQRFSRYIKENLFDEVKPGHVHYIENNINAETECERYAKLLVEAPIDIVCMGIGENGHLAFNDPPVANFHDTQAVKIVELDLICRQQQVNDGCYNQIDEVPTHAITLTIPTLLSAKELSVVVPGPTKRNAVYSTLHDAITTACPSTILRHHNQCMLLLDEQAYGEK